MIYIDIKDYVGKRVRVNDIESRYKNKLSVGDTGIVMRYSGGRVGVKVDGKINRLSSCNVFWLFKEFIELLEGENEHMANNLSGYNHVAIVNLLEDSYKNDYGFALYEYEYDNLLSLNENNRMVIVNPRGKDKKVLGIVKEIKEVSEYKDPVTAQVVGVVDITGFNFRIEDEKRIAEIAAKKKAIEEELNREIQKRKNVEFYEEMAAKYADNPRLAELVKDLKALSE